MPPRASLWGDVRRRRRAWSTEEKHRIVAESFEAGASVSVVARRHDLNSNLLFTWRRQIGAVASLATSGVKGFVPAFIAGPPAPLDKAYPAENAPLQETVWRCHLLMTPFAKGEAVFKSNFPKPC
jgi:transposase-like protein